MARPTYYSDGNTPNPRDTKYMVWTRILGALRDAGFGDSTMDPSPSDTVKEIRLKINRVLASGQH